MTGHESLDGPEFVKPIMPPMKDHPGLKVARSQKLFPFSSHLQKVHSNINSQILCINFYIR